VLHIWSEIYLESDCRRDDARFFGFETDVHTWGVLWHVACRQ